ncbi:MAG: TIGR04282 family arsenosugar biosynthesis glycosyltransferase [Cyanobacteriota bacterium]|nr:TIGR04282 family arsenosugar biosynthesis glycosyltransferase [Cyanobacteriota bacterium]
MSGAPTRRRPVKGGAGSQQLVLLGRWPAPSRCKRRLAATLGASRAAAVQRALLFHGLTVARQAANEGLGRGQPIEVVFAVSGLAPKASRRWAQALPVDRLVDQGPGSLGLRLQRQVIRARREGIGKLVLVGTDLPHLCSADLLAAFEALAGAALVLGPASDGGYWLIGLSPQVPAPRLFAGAHHPIPWGSGRVMACTLEAAAVEGLIPALVRERGDLDRAKDLLAWR